MLSALHLKPAEHLVGPHEYQDPKPGDKRAPCPFLNTMANHGYIHRNGKYITWPAAAKAIHECYNFSWLMAVIVASAGWYTGMIMGQNPFWFDLEQQGLHKPWLIEHDASLTRLDWPGNNHDPNPELIDQLISLASQPEGLSARDFAIHRINREAELDYTLSPFRHKLATGEVGLILPTLGVGSGGILPPDPADRFIPTNWARSFFQGSRIPDDWVKPAKALDPATVNSTAQRVRDEMEKLRGHGYPKKAAPKTVSN
jgi:hypothetical protein